MRGDPQVLLEETLQALGALDAAELERLQEEAEALPPLQPEAAIRCARRAAELQRSLEALLQSTEASMRVLRRIRSRKETPWEH